MNKVLYLAGGCFWGAQKFFDRLKGVTSTEVGYANGPTEEATYEQVCKNSGHAETVKVEFDDELMPVEKLLKYYFMMIDPLSVNKQGEDEGVQYRTGVYYEDEAMLPQIKAAFEEEAGKYSQPLAVELLPLTGFYAAEEYHQKYLEKHPTGYCHIAPWLFSVE